MITIWGHTFLRYLAKGHDHGSAAYMADQAEKRLLQRQHKETAK